MCQCLPELQKPYEVPAGENSTLMEYTAAQHKSKLIALEDRNNKLEYQLLHLKRAVKDGDTALKAAQPQQMIRHHK